MKLREHQELAITLTRESIAKGLKRPVIAAPTAFGKTVVAAYMLKSCQDKGKRGWFFCDRVKLVEQTIERFRSLGVDFGVRQADHELKNPSAPIQIASIQTVQSMIKNHNRGLPEFDMCIVDECHIQWELIRQIVDQYNNIPVIGLSATPYSKGLGKTFNNLIVPITPRELLDKDYLSPVKYFGGAHIDLSRVKSNDANTYRAKDIDRETDSQKERLVGDIVKNWLEHGEDSQTIAFSPTVATSEYLVQKLRGAGISAEHIDCYMSAEEKQDLFEAHDEGEFKVLSCSRLLNTGYDSPTTRCVIDCFPTKSVTTYVQRVGRITRKSEGKDYAIYLDHADNFSKFGYAEDIVPNELHDGEKPHNEKELTKDKKEKKTKECPECTQLMVGLSCSCGYRVVITNQMEDDGSMLKEIQEGTAANKRDSDELKTQFYSEMLGYAEEKGRKPGWAAYKYKDKYGVWPTGNKPNPTAPTDLVKGWIKHEAIRRKKAEESRDKAIENMKAMFDE